MWVSLSSLIIASPSHYRKMEVRQAQHPANSEFGPARVPSSARVHTIQLDRPSGDWHLRLRLRCIHILFRIVDSLLFSSLASSTLDTARNGFQYIIILPGGLQFISGIIDIQRGSYFGAITFIGLSSRLNNKRSYGAIVTSNGVTLLLDNLVGQVRRNYQQFLAVSNIASPPDSSLPRRGDCLHNRDVSHIHQYVRDVLASTALHTDRFHHPSRIVLRRLFSHSRWQISLYS